MNCTIKSLEWYGRKCNKKNYSFSLSSFMTFFLLSLSFFFFLSLLSLHLLSLSFPFFFFFLPQNLHLSLFFPVTFSAPLSLSLSLSLSFSLGLIRILSSSRQKLYPSKIMKFKFPDMFFMHIQVICVGFLFSQP